LAPHFFFRPIWGTYGFFQGRGYGRQVRNIGYKRPPLIVWDDVFSPFSLCRSSLSGSVWFCYSANWGPLRKHHSFFSHQFPWHFFNHTCSFPVRLPSDKEALSFYLTSSHLTNSTCFAPRVVWERVMFHSLLLIYFCLWLRVFTPVFRSLFSPKFLLFLPRRFRSLPLNHAQFPSGPLIG